MTKIQLTHLIRCSVETFWKTFSDAALQQQIFTSGLGYPIYRVTDQRVAGGGLTRRIDISPKLEIAGAAKKIVGPMFSYVEDGELRDGIYRFKLVPPNGVEATRATCQGEMRAEAADAGRTRRIVDLTISVQMPLVGKMLESVAVQALRDGYTAHAESLNKYLDAASADRAES